jgi:hypothetical protein
MLAAVRALGARKSPLERRCRAPIVIGFAFAAAIGLAPLPVLAQTPPLDPNAATTGSNLLQPSPLDGNPATPQRFRRPGQAAPLAADQPPPPNRFTTPSRIGATPTYGSPNGFGAGDTGYDSLNTPRKKKKKAAQMPPPTSVPGSLIAQQPEATFAPVPTYNAAAPAAPAAPVKPPPPVIYPKKAANRVGATLPPPPDALPVSNPPPEVHPLSAANRQGAVAAIPPSELFDYAAEPPPPTLQQPNTFALGTLPQRTLPMAESDPYAALGIRAGSFLLLPSLDLSGAYSSNPEHVPGGPPSFYAVAAPELQVRSDWSNHSLTADIAGSYTQYGADLVPSLNVPFLNSKIDGRIDVTRDTQINLEARALINTDNPGSPNLRSPNLQAALAKLPLNFDVGDTIGVAQQFNRLSVSFKGTFDRATYDASQFTDGTTSSNGDRNFDQWAGITRIGYEIDPSMKPFVEVQADERIHDEQFDRNGLERDSVGVSALLGTAVNLFGTLTGEMAAGYVDRKYQDPTLPNVTGVIANGALIWQPTGLTTAKLAASSQVYETVLDDASGELSRDVSLEVDHAFRTWLIGIARGGYGNDNYVGVPISDNRWFASAGIVYKLTREMQMNAQVRQDWQIGSPGSGLSYNATSFLLGLRLQR